MIASVQIETVLRPMVNGRVYPDIASENERTPYIVYQDISNQPEVTLEGPTGHEWVHVQIDVYDKGKLDCIKLANRVINEISNQIKPSVYGGKTATKDGNLNRTIIEFEFWQTADTE